MKTSVIRIGNSRGIRIPKTLLEQCRLKDSVELEVQNDELIVRPVAKARAGWEEAFRQMKRHGDDMLLDLPPSRWDQTEWRW